MRCLDLRVLLCLFFPIQFKFPDGSYSESPFPASARIFCITRLPQVDFRILLLSRAHHSMDPWHKVARIFEVPWIWWLYKRVFCGFRLYGRCDKEKPPCADAVQSWKYLLLGHHLHEAGFLGVHENGWLGSAPCAPCGTFLKDNDGRVYLIDTVLDVKDRSISQSSKFWEVLICILPCPTAVLGVGEGSRDRKVIVGGGLSPFWIIYTGSAVAVHYEVSTTYFPAVDSWTFVHLGTNWVFFQTGADQKLMNFPDGIDIESFWDFFGAPHICFWEKAQTRSLFWVWRIDQLWSVDYHWPAEFPGDRNATAIALALTWVLPNVASSNLWDRCTKTATSEPNDLGCITCIGLFWNGSSWNGSLR